jgi:hypothetical protein
METIELLLSLRMESLSPTGMRIKIMYTKVYLPIIALLHPADASFSLLLSSKTSKQLHLEKKLTFAIEQKR